MASRAALKPDSMRKIIKGYQACSPQLMQALRVIAENEHLRKESAAAGEATGQPKPRHYGGPYWGTSNMVPIISFASAGKGAAFEDQGTDVPHIPTNCRDPNCYALTITGDSMNPIYLEGDVVVVAPNAEAKSHDLVIVRTVEEDVFFKEVRFSADLASARLFSFNPNYPVMEFHRSQLLFIHPVHSVVRMLRSKPGN